MRHRNVGLKLNRTASHRNAMFRNMVTSLLKHERIRTTDVKAKEVRRWADHVITLAKRGDLHARRQAMAIVFEKDVVHKLFEEAKTKFGSREGGYTRIIKLGFRAGDAAPISMIELVYDQPEAKKGKKASKAKTAKAAPAETKATEAATEEKPAKKRTTAKKATATEEVVVAEAAAPEAVEEVTVASATENVETVEDTAATEPEAANEATDKEDK